VKRDLPELDNSKALSRIDNTLLLMAARLAVIEAQLTPAPSPGAAELLRAIHTLIGNRNFAASELIVLAQLPRGTALRAAIGRLNARSLGKRFQDIEGDSIDGLMLLRTGSDSAGTVWTVVEAIPIPVA
jgi:hypothetical protein